MTRSTIYTLLMPGFLGRTPPEWFLDALDNGVQVVCLYGSNTDQHGAGATIARELLERAPGPLLIATDEEGGDVTRLEYEHGSSFVGNRALGLLDDEHRTKQDATAIAGLCASQGVRLDLAPVADVNTEPRNPVVGNRSFGSDTDLVTRHTTWWVEACQSAGVAATAKHFPGHGDTTVDSHRGLAQVEGGWQEIRAHHLQPFIAAIDAGVACIMTAHVLLDSALPASQDPETTRVLRDELGFTGVIMTDALDMAGALDADGIPGAAVRSLQAGADLLCLGSAVTAESLDAVVAAIEQALHQGVLDEAALLASATRVRALVEAYGSTTMPTIEQPEPSPWTLSREALGTRTIVRFATEHNPAVGEAPWLEIDHSAPQHRATPDSIAQVLDSVEGDVLVVVRHQEALGAMVSAWPDSRPTSSAVIACPGPVVDTYGFDVIDTVGAARPQAAALDDLLRKVRV